MSDCGKLLAACCLILLSPMLSGQGMNHIRIIPYYEGSKENAIDTAGDILFEDRWDFLFRLDECGCFLGIHFLEKGGSEVRSTYDGLPADYALLFPDGTSEILHYDEIGDHIDDKLAVLQEKWGVVDCHGQWIVRPCMEFPPDLHEEYILFRKDSLIEKPQSSHRHHLYGIMDYSGKVLLPAEYLHIEMLDWWSDAHFIVTDVHQRNGLVNATGRIVLHPDSVGIYPSLTDESVWVLSAHEPWVYYPAGNRWIRDDVQALTRGVFGLEEGLSLLPWRGDWQATQWVSKDRQLQIEASTDNVRRLFRHPWMKFERILPDGTAAFGIIGKDGHVLLPPIYEDIYEEHEDEFLFPASAQCVFEGTASVRLNGHWGLVDTMGNFLTHVVYDDMQGLSEGIVAVEVDGKTGFIDREGQKVVPFIFDWTNDRWKNGIGIAHVIESPVFLNREGRIIWKSWNEGDDPYFQAHMNEERFTLTEGYPELLEEESGVPLKEMKVLDLGGRGLIRMPDFLSELRQIETLIFSGNHIREIRFDLGNLPRLQSLDLKENDLFALPASIGKLHRLEYLDLSHNQLRSLPLEITHCKHLHTLDLRGNQLETLPDGLLGMKNLRVLELANNPLQPAQLNQIRMRRPDLLPQ